MMKNFSILLYNIIFCVSLVVSGNEFEQTCEENGGICETSPECRSNAPDCDISMKDFRDECGMVGDGTGCGDNEVCCSKTPKVSEGAMTSRIFGKKCRNTAGGECKWSCSTPELSPNDCPFWRKCCKKKNCANRWPKCGVFHNSWCVESTCPINQYEISNACHENNGATCHCCADCKVKMFSTCKMLNGRCTRADCAPNEFRTNGCKDNACHCCADRCRRRFGCWWRGGYCTEEQQCNVNHYMVQSEKACKSYGGASCRCCAPCRRRFKCMINRGRCISGQCSIDEFAMEKGCTDNSCRCCAPRCRKTGYCKSVGGRCTTQPCGQGEETLIEGCKGDSNCHCCAPKKPCGYDFGCWQLYGGKCRPKCGWWESYWPGCNQIPGCYCCRSMFWMSANMSLSGKPAAVGDFTAIDSQDDNDGQVGKDY